LPHARIPPRHAYVPLTSYPLRTTRPTLDELAARLGWALPALAALVLGIFRLPELTRSPLWYDEIFAVGVASLPFADAMRAIIADHTNPPLFYLLLKGWLAMGGDGDHWVRLLPCVFAMLLGAALVWLAREVRAGARAGVLAVALAAASPLLVDLANEARAYSLLALLACLALAAVLRDRERRTRESFALLTLVNIALVHTHYFGWLTVGAVCLAAIAWPRESAGRVWRSAGLTLLAFLPWAGTVLAHAMQNPSPLRNVAWITTPDPAAPLWLFRDFTGRSGAASVDSAWLAFAGVALVVLAVRRLRAARGAAQSVDEPRDDHLLLLALAGLAVPIAVWAVSVGSGHSIWVQRYLLGAAAPTILLTAIAIASLPPRGRAPWVLLAFAWVTAACVALPQRAPAKFDWRRFIRRIDVAAGSPRDVFALEGFTAAPLQRYARAGMRIHVVRSLDELPAGEAWLVYRRDSFASGSAGDALRARGFTTVTALSAETVGQRIVAARIRQ